MANKWQVRWPCEVFNKDGSIYGTIELTDEHCVDKNGYYHFVQVDFDVTTEYEIKIDYVFDDDYNEWKGIPSYIKAQILKEAKSIFECKDNETYRKMVCNGEIVLKNVNDFVL